MLILTIATQSFASGESYEISKPCLDKLTIFAGEFAKVSKMNFGQTAVSIGALTINKDAELVGESGYADGTGSYELKMEDQGEINTTEVKFNFRFAAEPHCSVLEIKLSELLD